MRSVLDENQFTPFGLWIGQYCKKSDYGLSVTNLDYVFEDFKQKKIMLVEEKQNNGCLHKAQLLTFKVLDYALSSSANSFGYDYWGVYVLKLPKGASMPGPGMTLNNLTITCEQLQNHLNFNNKFCRGYRFNTHTMFKAA